MKRTIIKIDEDLCNGCGSCIVGCHEGALQLIDNKARLISELFCDGLGACIGDCPEGAIILEEREAEAYSEVETLKRIVLTGDNTVVAHLNHLKEHGEDGYLNEALNYLKENNINTNFKNNKTMETKGSQCGCPGSAMQDLRETEVQSENTNTGNVPSQLRQWPVQMHLISPNAPYFRNADVLIAADCVAFALGNTHAELMKGKSIGIACPKLDSDMEVYVEKITAMIDDAKINTLTVAIMEVPCCGGLLRIAQSAVENATRKVPIKAITVGINGSIIDERWV
ncbi:MAG: 4Fe-4S ferredoxin [Bacteroidetes bacterium]|nr:4Fe-4S ferredoxin [Bacteroidota bacterium]